MSIEDTNKIDAIGISDDGTTLALLLSDHLDWSDEYEHLLLLQEKINAYIAFIESEQYKEIYPEKNFVSYNVEICFLHELTENALKFINVVNDQLSENNINFDVTISD